jgi:ribonuclease I
MKFVRITCGALCVVFNIAATAQAEPSCNVLNQEKIYRLELSVPATFCKKEGKNDPSCTVLPKKSLLQLHGLWPNYKKKGYPEGQCTKKDECKTQADADGKYCKYPEPAGLYESEAWKELAEGYMAGKEKCLERHEWVKHGTCTEMTPPEYFAWALKKTKEISEKLALEPDKEISKDAFNKLVKDKLPELDGAIHLSCKKKLVSSLYVIYEWGKEPGAPMKTSGGQNAMGNCKNTFIFPSK